MTDGPGGRRALAICALVIIVLGACPAAAHLMRAGHGTINVVGEKAYVVLSLPVAAFAGGGAADAVADGILTTAELEAHKAALREAIRDGIRVEVGGRRATLPTVMLSLPTGDGHAPDRGADLTVMIVAELGGAPSAITFGSTLWADDASALRIRATVSEGRETLRGEIGEVHPGEPVYVFFATPGQTFVGFLRRGLTHFAGGPDHLVFALMLLIAALDRRRRIGWAVAFAAGCWGGLALSATGRIGLAAPWIEAAIGLSVALIAALALSGKRLPTLPGGLLIAGCAVFHGLGFASISRFGTHLPTVKVVGFGLGVALGLALLSALWLLIGRALRRGAGDGRLGRVSRGLAVIGCALGLWWAGDRLAHAWSTPLTMTDAPRQGHGPGHRAR